MKTQLVTAPSAEPLTLDEAKAHLRVEIDTDDDLIEAQIATARQLFEAQTWRALVTQTWDGFLDDWPDDPFIELPYPPLQSVTSISYTDADGNSYTLPTTDYGVDVAADPGRVTLKYGKSWPGVTLATVNPIRVRFVAGYGAATVVPALVKQGLLFLVGHYYENREAVTVQTGAPVKVPLAVESIMLLYKAGR